jgi:AraC-like DNA-binding protein
MQNQHKSVIPIRKYDYYLPESFPLLVERNTLTNNTIDFLHYHPGLEIGLCISGAGTFVIEEKVFSFAAGDLFVINSLEMHLACVPKGQETVWDFIIVEPETLLNHMGVDLTVLDTSLFCGKGFVNKIDVRKFPILVGIAKEIISEYETKPALYLDNLKACVIRFLIELKRIFPNLPEGLEKIKRTTGMLDKLQPAIAKITRDYSTALSLKNLAESCLMSPSYLRTLFYRIFQKSPMDYLNDFRIAQVCHQLKTTSRPIIDIAYDCGFQTLSCFNRQFKKKRKISPRLWRKRN